MKRLPFFRKIFKEIITDVFDPMWTESDTYFDNLLLENGDNLLQEDGSFILLETN